MSRAPTLFISHGSPMFALEPGILGSNLRDSAPHAARAHPTEEHYLPLLVALGASHADEPRQLVEGGMTYGVLSMDSFGFGLPADDTAEAA